MTGSFDWRDGERTIFFGSGRLADAVGLVGGAGYTLLTTPRAEAEAPHLIDGATDVRHVAEGRVDELAANLLDAVEGDRLVALGGGRVIDVAKAVAAARNAGGTGGGATADEGAPRSAVAAAASFGPCQVAAVPTTLSGAEMSRGHRHAKGVPAGTPRVRPAIVVFDPALAASQPVPDLAASALNAMAHAVEAPCTRNANPVATLAGDEAARLIAHAFAGEEPDRDALALGALLGGYAIDSAGFGLHHVLSQTIVRVAAIPHGAGNAVLLPHTIRALAERFPERLAAVGRALGEDPAAAAERIRDRTGARTLGDLGVAPDDLERAAEAAAQRGDLAETPPAAERDEILAIYRRAY